MSGASTSDPADPFPDLGHDHDRCIETALASAAALCEERGVRLTQLRRQVLELIWASHRPIGAYEILNRLVVGRGPTAPPTVYRALEFLSDQRLVHRIDTLNAFVGCGSPVRAHKAYFLICSRCGDAAEVADEGLDAALAEVAQQAGFAVRNETVELAGICARCGRGEADAVGPSH